MPMDVTTLKTALKTSLDGKLLPKIRDKNPELAALLDDSENPADINWLVDALTESVSEAVAEEVIPHIQTNADVIVTVVSVSGVTTGVGTSGPGTGTGTIS